MFQLDKGAISELSMVEMENGLLGKKASVAGAKADLRSAILDLEFTKVIAPADGYVTNLKLQPGSNTVANQAALALIDATASGCTAFLRKPRSMSFNRGTRPL